MLKRNLVILTGVIALTFAAAEARRGFSSGGSGSGAYNNAAPSAWSVDSTLDADCQALYGKACSDLTAAQYEDVKTKNTQATSNNYASDTDYQTANGKGYTLSASDGTQWTNAKSPGGRGSDTTSDAAWNTDCDSSYSSTGGCDGLTKSQFSSIDDSSTGRTTALSTGYSSYDDWQSASALSYTMSAADATLWGEANDGSVSSAACDAEFAGKSCNELSKASFTNAKASNALITAKIAKVTAGTLTSADLVTDLGISLTSSTLTSPISAWQLDYLETVLGTTSGTTKADWQTTIDGYNEASASAWYIWKIAASTATTGTYAASNADYALFKTANVDSGLTGLASVCSVGGSVASGIVCGKLGVTNAQIAADIRNAGFTAAPSATAMRDFLTEARGFTDGTTYASILPPLTNGWSVGNWITAVSNTGWTNSAADKATFDTCYSNTDSASGGANACTITKASWTSVSSLASASDPDDLTSSDIQGVLAAVNTTDSDGAFGDLTALTSVEVDFIQDCMGSTTTSSAMKTCVTGATATSVPVYNIAKTIDGDYSGGVTTALLEDAGIDDIDTATGDEDILAFLKSNKCGTNGTSACSAALGSNCGSGGSTACGTASLVSSGTSATQAQILSYVKSAALAYTKKLAQSAALPASSGSRCSSITVAAPAPCGVNSAFSCTGVSGWTYTANASTGTLTKSAPITGSLYSKVKITRKAWWGGSGYNRTISRSVSLSSAGSGSTSYAYGNQDYGLSPSACKNAQTQCTSAGGTILTWNNLPSAQRRTNSKFFYPDSNVTSGWTRYGTIRNQYNGPTDLDLTSSGWFPGSNSEWWNQNSSSTSWGNSYCDVRCRTTACN